MTTLEQHRAEGVKILGELEAADSPDAAARAVARERQWAKNLLFLLEPAEAAFMEPLSPFKTGERIGIPTQRVETLGHDWAMSWQCHFARLYRLREDILPVRINRPRPKKPGRKTIDDSEAIARARELMRLNGLEEHAAAKAVFPDSEKAKLRLYKKLLNGADH
jgi:hypothetical protein